MAEGQNRLVQAMIDRLAPGAKARADRHNQGLPAEERGSQFNQDWDHYLVGNEMAGPQYPMWQRLGAVAPMVGHEIARPLIAKSKLVTDSLNRVVGSEDQPVWVGEGAGAGGAAAEAPPDVAGALRNLKMLYRGASGGVTPSEEQANPDVNQNLIRALMLMGQQ